MITICTYLKNQSSCLSDFLRPYSNESENKNKLYQFLAEPILVQKKYIPHMKALTLSYFEPKRQGRGIPMGAPCPDPFKFFYVFFSEVLEAMRGG